MVMQQAPAAPPAPASFLAAARLREQPIGSVDWDGGLGVPRIERLLNTGYLSRVDLLSTVTGQYATAGPTGVDAFGQYGGPIERVTLRANSIGELFDCSGEMLAIISAIDSQYHHGNTEFNPQPPGAFVASPGTNPFTDKWAYSIPVALQLSNKPWPLGLFQLAINSQEVNLEVRFRPIAGGAGDPGAGIYTGNVGNLTNGDGDVAINQVYFDPIPEPAAQPSLAFVHQWREWQHPLNNDGDVDIRLPTNNLYLRVILWFVDGAPGALAPNPNLMRRLRLQYGANVAPYDWTADQLVARMKRQYGNLRGVGNSPLPDGAYCIDLLEETHTERDIINANATTELRLTATLQGGTYTGGAYVKVAVEQLIPLQVGPAPTA